MVEPGRRAAVVGSGFGGLAVAIRLQAMGLPTVLFEARDKPGGRAYVYEEQGYTFDAGPTVITAPHCLEELYELTGRKLSDHVELLPVRPFYRLLWDDGDRFDYDNDQEALLEQTRRRSPSDVEGYLRFAEFSKAVFAEGYERLVAEPFLRFSDMVKVAPKLIGLRADRSVYGAVSKYVKDEHLRQAFSFQALLVGGNPMDTSSLYALIHHLEKKWGVFFPRGGTGALVRALVAYFQALGGELRLSTPVQEIEARVEADGRPKHLVTTQGREREAFDLVVSNADVHPPFTRLFGRTPKAQRRADKLARKDWSMSLFVLYFGTDRPYDLAHHTVLFGPRYRGLLDEIFNGPSLPDDFSLYLHAPTVTDPSLAPPGCGSYYVLSPVPHLGKADVDWKQQGAAYAEKILAALERHMPGLREHVVVKRWFTPQDFQSELGAFQGSAFSCAPTLTQSAWFRVHNRDPDIPGLYMVGAGTHPGAGVPGVVNSAKATARVIAEDLGLSAPRREVA